MPRIVRSLRLARVTPGVREVTCVGSHPGRTADAGPRPSRSARPFEASHSDSTGHDTRTITSLAGNASGFRSATLAQQHGDLGSDLGGEWAGTWNAQRVGDCLPVYVHGRFDQLGQGVTGI